MLLGGLGYTAYAAQMLYLSDYLLYTCALLNGLGASLLWTGQGYGTQRFMSDPHFTLLLNSGKLLYWGRNKAKAPALGQC